MRNILILYLSFFISCSKNEVLTHPAKEPISRTQNSPTKRHDTKKPVSILQPYNTAKTTLDLTEGYILKTFKTEKNLCLLGGGLFSIKDEKKVYICDDYPLKSDTNIIQIDTQDNWSYNLKIHKNKEIRISAKDGKGNLIVYSWPDGKTISHFSDVHYNTHWSLSPDFEFALLVDSKPDLNWRVRLRKKGQVKSIFECKTLDNTNGKRATFSQDYKSVIVPELHIKGEAQIYWSKLNIIRTKDGKLIHSLDNSKFCAVSEIDTLGPKNYLIESECKTRNLIDIDSGKVLGRVDGYLDISFPKDSEHAIGINNMEETYLLKLELPTLKPIAKITLPLDSFGYQLSPNKKYAFFKERGKLEFFAVDLSNFKVIGHYSLPKNSLFTELHINGYIENKGLVFQCFKGSYENTFFILDIHKNKIIAKSNKSLPNISGASRPVRFEKKLNLLQIGSYFFQEKK